MCMFSGRVKSVANTKIFTRASRIWSGTAQYLVYEMTVAADAELAMVLPLPVPPRPREDVVSFLPLIRYPAFFQDLAQGFRELTRGAPTRGIPAPAPQSLRVVDVGDFEASFVPTRDDFERLDPRFRLPANVWGALHAYDDWGFAVFKLKSGRRDVHPMALEFPRRDPSRLFFPTLHVHDGDVHDTAAFDHILYYQGEPRDGWTKSNLAARHFMRVEDGGIVDRDALVHKRELRGTHKNEDQYV